MSWADWIQIQKLTGTHTYTLIYIFVYVADLLIQSSIHFFLWQNIAQESAHWRLRALIMDQMVTLLGLNWDLNPQFIEIITIIMTAESNMWNFLQEFNFIL